jgi:hypothetical protein
VDASIIRADAASTPADASSLPADLARSDSAPPGGSVNCGATICSIPDGEHCFDRSRLVCQTAACGDSDQFDCDGPEDCPGAVCCFPKRNAFSRAACASSCPAMSASVLCHETRDCRPGQVCCLNFLLGPSNGLCLGACD